MTGCQFPEHHSTGGGWGGPIAAIFAAMILAAILGPLLHWLEIAAACVGIGAVITLGLAVRRRHIQRQLSAQYQPQVGSPRWRPGLPQEQPRAVEQHIHHHWEGVSPEEIAAIMARGRANGR